MAKLVIQRAGIDAAKAAAGFRTDDQVARAAGLHPTQFSRVMSGRSEPGNKFIAGMVEVFGRSKFWNLFAVVSDDEGAEA